LLVPAHEASDAGQALDLAQPLAQRLICKSRRMRCASVGQFWWRRHERCDDDLLETYTLPASPHRCRTAPCARSEARGLPAQPLRAPRQRNSHPDTRPVSNDGDSFPQDPKGSGKDSLAAGARWSLGATNTAPSAVSTDTEARDVLLTPRSMLRFSLNGPGQRDARKMRLVFGRCEDTATSLPGRNSFPAEAVAQAQRQRSSGAG
jgi:hypothetical protein